MTNENENKPVEEQTTPQEQQQKSVDIFLEAAKKVKEDTVSKELYDEAIASNKKLLDHILEGKDLPDEGKESTPSIAELVKVRNNPNATNLDIVKASLGIRKHYLEEKGIDIFALKPEEAEYGKKTAQIFQKLVDESGDDPKKFMYLFEESMANDDSALMNAIRKRRQAN